MKTTHVDVTQTDEYKAVMLEINEINQKRSNIRKTIQDKVSGIDDKISELTQEKSEIEVSRSIEKSNKHLDDVISELRNEEDRLLDEKERYSHDLYILKEFTTTLQREQLGVLLLPKSIKFQSKTNTSMKMNSSIIRKKF